jgi:hypothetical protein
LVHQIEGYGEPKTGNVKKQILISDCGIHVESENKAKKKPKIDYGDSYKSLSKEKEDEDKILLTSLSESSLDENEKENDYYYRKRTEEYEKKQRRILDDPMTTEPDDPNLKYIKTKFFKYRRIDIDKPHIDNVFLTEHLGIRRTALNSYGYGYADEFSHVDEKDSEWVMVIKGEAELNFKEQDQKI